MENTQTNLSQLEVLAPAGNPESFNAAINNGADAIYLGLSSFNARMKAQNFTTENIREYVSLAHSFGTKIYVTINTLIENEDFDVGTIVSNLCTGCLCRNKARSSVSLSFGKEGY